MNPIEEQHFTRWIQTFITNINSEFTRAYPLWVLGAGCKGHVVSAQGPPGLSTGEKSVPGKEGAEDDNYMGIGDISTGVGLVIGQGVGEHPGQGPSSEHNCPEVNKSPGAGNALSPVSPRAFDAKGVK